MRPAAPGTDARRPHIVIAPDSFKGSLDAVDVAEAMADGVRATRPDARITVLPMADGGEGSLTALAAAWGARLRTVATVDALGRPTVARWTTSRDGRVGVVELAESSGLPTVSDTALRPLHAHTRGMGQVAAAVLDAEVEEVLVCLGGSASVDGGAGMLVGLGARVLDATGAPVPDGGQGLAHAARIDLSGLHPRAREVRWRVAVDVTSPLTGPHGAAAVFGPQKGAGPDEITVLDDALAHWAALLEQISRRDLLDVEGGGAAGGVPVALVALLGATIERGAELVAEAVGLPDALADADLVMTGEGSFDVQSLQGKVPDAVARAAAAGRTRPPVVVLAGQVLVPVAQLRAAGIRAAFSIAPGPVALAELIRTTSQHLANVAAHVTALVLPSPPPTHDLPSGARRVAEHG